MQYILENIISFHLPFMFIVVVCKYVYACMCERDKKWVSKSLSLTTHHIIAPFYKINIKNEIVEWERLNEFSAKKHIYL